METHRILRALGVLVTRTRFEAIQLTTDILAAPTTLRQFSAMPTAIILGKPAVRRMGISMLPAAARTLSALVVKSCKASPSFFGFPITLRAPQGTRRIVLALSDGVRAAFMVGASSTI